jgi:hypothetical protein
MTKEGKETRTITTTKIDDKKQSIDNNIGCNRSAQVFIL